MRNLHTEDKSCTTSQNKLLHGKHKHVKQVQQSLSQFCNSLGSKTSNSSLILIGSSIPPYTINQSLNKIKESTNQMTSQDTCASNFISLIGAFRSSSHNLISGHSNWELLHVICLWPVGPLRPKLAVSFPKILVSSPTLLSSSKNFGWKLCFNWKMSFHFLLIIPLVSNWLVWQNGKAPQVNDIPKRLKSFNTLRSASNIYCSRKNSEWSRESWSQSQSFPVPRAYLWLFSHLKFPWVAVAWSANPST